MEHIDIHPDHMSFKELIQYCEEHNDPWVRAVANYAYSFSYHVDEEYRSDPDYYFEYIEEKIHDLERSAEYAQEEEEAAYREKEEWKEKYDALKLEFNLREEHHTITHLKARVQCLHDEIDNIEKQRRADAEEHSKVVKQLDSLKKEFKYLTEKHNTWEIISG